MSHPCCAFLIILLQIYLHKSNKVLKGNFVRFFSFKFYCHFVVGKKSDNPTNPDFVPSIFSLADCGQKRMDRFERLNKRKCFNSLAKKNDSSLLDDHLEDVPNTTFEEETESSKLYIYIYYMSCTF